MFLTLAKLILVMAGMGTLLNAPDREFGSALFFTIITVGVCLIEPVKHMFITRRYFSADNPHTIDILPDLKRLRRRNRVFSGVLWAMVMIVLAFTGLMILLGGTEDGGGRFLAFAVCYAGLATVYKNYLAALNSQIAGLTGQKEEQISQAVKREDIRAIPADEMKQFSKLRFRYLGYLAGFVIGVPVALTIITGGAIAPFSGTFVLAATITYMMALPRLTRAYRVRVKARFLPDLIKKLGLSYSSQALFDMDALHPHGIIQPYTHQTIDDAFYGEINGRKIEVQEYALDYISEHKPDLKEATLNAVGGGTQSVQRGQRGVAVRIPLNRKLQCHTLVFSKSRLNNITRRFAGYKPVGLISSKLNAFYEVYANDQVESRYIFDPAFMERFAGLIHTLPIANVEISFKNQELAILCLQDKDHFETGSLFSRLRPDSFEPVVREIEAFKSIVELLALDADRGL